MGWWKVIMKQYVYHDCDNTMGLPECDMDDGMALLYLLGRNDVQIEAVTTSFGNSTINKVHANTQKMFQELHLEHIPLKKGAPSHQQRDSEASHHLANEIVRCKKPVKLLITGSTGNIYAACLENEKILDHIDEMIFMGGITEPLVIGGKGMNELNFSIDPEAIHYLINCPVKKTIICAQLCLQAFFDNKKMEGIFSQQQYPIFDYMRAPLQLWYDFISQQYEIPGFYVWDVVAAIYLTTPSLFDKNDVYISSTVEDLKEGSLKIDMTQSTSNVNLPTKILDLERFWRLMFDSWKNVSVSLTSVNSNGKKKRKLP